MSKLYVDTITNREGTNSVSFPNGITGTAATFSGNVSIAGTLTYEDVTNIDSVGLITARSGIQVLAGGINASGVVTATSFEGDTSDAISGKWTLGVDGTNSNYTFTVLDIY